MKGSAFFGLRFWAVYVLGLSSVVLGQTKIICLGDSITKGAVDPNPSMSGYRARLFDDFNQAGSKYQFIGRTVNNSNRLMISAGQAYHDGFGSYRIDQIFKNLDGVQSVGSGDDNMGGYWLTGGNGTFRDAMYPDVVLLLGGSNDLGQGANEEELESRMTNLLTWFQTNRPKVQLFVATVPPRGPEKPGQETYNLAVKVFNDWLTQKLPSFGDHVHIVDLHALFVNQTGQVKGLNAADGIFLQDGIHPSHNGYVAMGHAWFTAIKPFLTTSTASSVSP
jgi:lysophospholipase L1-like esterase